MSTSIEMLTHLGIQILNILCYPEKVYILEHRDKGSFDSTFSYTQCNAMWYICIAYHRIWVLGMFRYKLAI